MPVQSNEEVLKKIEERRILLWVTKNIKGNWIRHTQRIGHTIGLLTLVFKRTVEEIGKKGKKRLKHR